MADQASERMPTSIKIALVGVWFQAVANAFGGFALLTDVQGRLDHGQEVQNLGLVQGLLYFSLIVAAVLVVCGVLAPRRFRWVRVVVLIIEAVAVLNALLGLVSGGAFPMLIGLLLALVIGAILLTDKGQDWFNR
ncbi:hypothetical protein AB0I81_10230 [Nonomuraea sp. NPDC050404]|uniref:hypothetical protein n=1 Tax=Nonomuraea sp. NPDC050404 TaxID=3155783 RepID=UPI0033D9286F